MCGKGKIYYMKISIQNNFYNVANLGKWQSNNVTSVFSLHA